MRIPVQKKDLSYWITKEKSFSFRSSITTLNFSSSFQILGERGNPEAGEYVVIVEPENQIITVSAPGYIAQRISLRALSPNQFNYYTVEPVLQSITDTGSLLVRSNPAGAKFTIVGIPGVHTTPASFDDILAQTYTVRFELDGYESNETQIQVDPLRPNLHDEILIPTFGFLTLNTEDAQLLVSTEAVTEEYRINYSPGQQRQLDVGTYNYRVTRRYFRDATGTFEINPGENTELNVALEPDFASMRVRTNVPRFTLRADDNEAPESGRMDIIYLERGQRTVTVDAPGYASETISLLARAGATIDTTITLFSMQELQERQRLEALPRGILNLSSDVDAEIYINGENRGTGSVSLSMVPDTYQIEMRHELGRERFSVRVPSADIAEQHIIFLPSKSTALTRSALLPGMGHIYTKRSRGYLYLALAGSAAGYAVYNFLDYNSLSSDHDLAITNYQNAGSLQDASRFRSEIHEMYSARVSAHDNILIGVGAFGAIYLLQLADVAITSPRFGYRTENGNEFRAGLMAGRIGIQHRF